MSHYMPARPNATVSLRSRRARVLSGRMASGGSPMQPLPQRFVDDRAPVQRSATINPGFWRDCVFALVVCCLATRSLVAGEATDAAAQAKLSPNEFAAWIDARFDESWRKQGIQPAER